MRILVTGCAGFIGYHLCRKLLDRGDFVIGIDDFTGLIYDSQIKFDRIDKIVKDYGDDNFKLTKYDLAEICIMTAYNWWEDANFDCVVHLAAHANVRPGIKYPYKYINSNIVAFQHIIEKVREYKISNFVFASSSSVYGNAEKYPVTEDMKLDKPISLYAATKLSNELVAHAYSDMFDVNCTGLRFFTVYGPWGRPDMALMKFIKNILEDKPIELYNKGDMQRDFTYIDDILIGLIHCIDNINNYEIYNIGCGRCEWLMDFVKEIEKACGKELSDNDIKWLPMQPGDVEKSWCSTDKLQAVCPEYGATTPISEGIPKTVEWYREYYNV